MWITVGGALFLGINAFALYWHFRWHRGYPIVGNIFLVPVALSFLTILASGASYVLQERNNALRLMEADAQSTYVTAQNPTKEEPLDPADDLIANARKILNMVSDTEACIEVKESIQALVDAETEITALSIESAWATVKETGCLKTEKSEPQDSSPQNRP